MLNPFDLSIKKRIGNFNKTIEVDSDKSISIRSFLIGAICQKVSSVKNVLESDDVLSTISCLRKLGVKIKINKIKPNIDLFIYLNQHHAIYYQPIFRNSYLYN